MTRTSFPERHLALRSVAEPLLHIAFPQECPVCGAPCVPICDDCLDRVIADCPPPERGEARALCAHCGAARDLLLTVKYRRLALTARAMGRRAAGLLSEDVPRAVVPIPPHRKKGLIKERENCALWLAKGISDRTGWKVRPLLEWNGIYTPQKEQPDRAGRLSLAHGCFGCAKRPPSRVLLVDDVCTTGTTLARAAECLRAAGAQDIAAIVWSATDDYEDDTQKRTVRG